VGALVRAGHARERERSSRRDARDLGSSGLRCSVSETRCNGGAFRDRSSPASGSGHPSQMGGVRRRAKQCFATRLPHPWPLLVWPSLAKQLPPGTTIAPLTLQRNRHGSVPPFQRGARTFQFPKERRDRVGPSRTVFGQGRPKRSAARPSLHGCTRGVSWTGPPDPGAGSLERKVSGILPGGCKPPFRGQGPLPQARSYNRRYRSVRALRSSATCSTGWSLRISRRTRPLLSKPYMASPWDTS